LSRSNSSPPACFVVPRHGVELYASPLRLAERVGHGTDRGSGRMSVTCKRLGISR
jgi:hypothetical protein